MTFKDAVNTALYRATGYMLTRETPEQRREAIRRAADRAAAQAAARARKRTAERHRRLAAEREAKRKEREARRLAEERAEREARAVEQRRLAEQRAAERAARKKADAERRAAERAARVARGDDLPRQYDDSMRAIIARVRPRTMTGPPKLGSLIEAVRYVVRQQIPGEVVECGVWRGGSMQAIALTLLELGDTTRELHLFDTFEGMPPPSDNDTRTAHGVTQTAAEMLATSDKDSNLWAIAGLDDVRAGMAETAYPQGLIHYHPGLVEETTPGEAPDTIALLRLDTDWYGSTRHELEHLYSRLSPGGVLILDDYGDWDGARKATEEWLAESNEPIFLAPMGTGRIAVKPPVAGHVADAGR